MSYFNNNKWWAIIVGLLIVLNTATLTFFWFERKNNLPQLPPQNNRGGARAYLTKELALDSLQQLQYTKLIEQHQQQTSEIRLQIRDAKDAFFSLLTVIAPSTETINQAAKHAVELEQQLDILTFNHFKNMRAICNATQQKKFDTIIKNAVKMMGPLQRPQGPPMDDRKGFPPPLQNGERQGFAPTPQEGQDLPPKK